MHAAAVDRRARLGDAGGLIAIGVYADASMVWFIMSLLIGGLMVGALGRLVHPGRDPMSLPLTIGIGVAAMFIAGFVLRPLLGFGGGFVTAVVVAIVLVWLFARQTGGGSRAA
jgi:uncharacterized membrane protein YeaQ/YmgE (transglycosylase-associated protein family)